MFRTVPLSVIRNFSLYTQQWYMSYRFADSLQAGSWSCLQAVGKPVWRIPLLCVQWKTPDDGQRNWPKHVEFYAKNKFEKLVHLVGFIIRNLSLRTVTRMSNLVNVLVYTASDDNIRSYRGLKCMWKKNGCGPFRGDNLHLHLLVWTKETR